MSIVSTLFDPHFYVQRYKLYLSNLNLSKLETNDLAVENVLELDTDQNVTKKMPIFDITKFGLRDETGTITFNKKPGGLTITLDPYYNTTQIDGMFVEIQDHLLSLITNIQLNYYTKTQIDAQRVWYRALVEDRNMFFVDNLYELKDPSEIAKSKRKAARVLHITEDGIVFTKSQLDVPGDGENVAIPLLTALAGGAAGALGGLFVRKGGLSGTVSDPSVGLPDMPQLRLSVQDGVSNVPWEGRQYFSAVQEGIDDLVDYREVRVPDAYDAVDLGRGASRGPSFMSSQNWSADFAGLRSGSMSGGTAGLYQPPAVSTFNAPTTSHFVAHENGKLVSLDAKSTAQHLSHALSLDQESMTHLLYTAGLTISNNEPNDARFGRVVLTTQAAPSTLEVVDPQTGEILVPYRAQQQAQLLIPAGQSQAYSTAQLDPSALLIGRLPILTDDGSTGTVGYNEIKSNILDSIPEWVTLDTVPIAKLDFKPSSWDGTSAVGDYTNGLRFPESAGLNTIGYRSTIIGFNAGRLPDLSDPGDEYTISTIGGNTLIGHQTGQRISTKSSNNILIGRGNCSSVANPVNRLIDAVIIGNNVKMPNSGISAVTRPIFIGSDDLNLESNIIRIGRSSSNPHTKCFLGGIQATLATTVGILARDANNQIGTLTYDNFPFMLKSDMYSTLVAYTPLLTYNNYVISNDAKIYYMNAAINQLTYNVTNNYVSKGFAYDTFMMQINVFDKVASDGRYAYKTDSYTKIDSDERYVLKGTFGYTKAEADALFPLKTLTYTKAQVDSLITALAPGGTMSVDAYTKTQSDTRYYRKGIIDSIPYDMIDNYGSDGVAFSHTLRFPRSAAQNLVRSGGENDGIQNTIVGSVAGVNLTTGYSNVFVGRNAGEGFTTGYQNVCIGRNSGQTAGNSNYNVAIGAATTLASGANYQIVIGYGQAGQGAGTIKIGGTGYASGTYLSGVRNFASSDDLIVTVSSGDRLGARSLTTAVGLLAYSKSYIDEVYYTKLGAAAVFRTLDDSYSKSYCDSIYRTIANSYTKTQCDTLFRTILNSYSKAECDDLFATKQHLNDIITASVAPQLEGYYKKTETYNKTEVDTKFDQKRTVYTHLGNGDCFIGWDIMKVEAFARIHLNSVPAGRIAPINNVVTPSNFKGRNPSNLYTTTRNVGFGCDNFTQLHRNIQDNVVVGMNNQSGYLSTNDASSDDAINNIVIGTNNMNSLKPSKHNIIIGRGIFNPTYIPREGQVLRTDSMAVVTNCIAIGLGTYQNEGLVSSSNVGQTYENRIYLGNKTHTSLYCFGARATSIVGSTLALGVNTTTGKVGPMSSSLRYKNDVTDVTEEEIEAFESLTPKRYKYNDNGPEAKDNWGFIAEEAHEKFPGLCVYNSDGQPDTFAYNSTNALLAASNKKLRGRVSDLENTVTSLHQKNIELEARLNDQSLRMARLQKLMQRDSESGRE